MGNAAICPDCGGKGTRWDSAKRIVKLCWKCRGTGSLTKDWR
jgi:DnaJ-class molecular chaperone